MQQAMAGGERVLGLLDTAPDVADPPDGRAMGAITGRVELRQVAFSYRNNTPILHGIDLQIAPGQTVALVGPTGAGKTTVANLVARFYDVTAGAVLIDGVDVRTVTQASLRHQMGLVPQDPFLFSGTIRDNIRFGKLTAADDEVIAAAVSANAHEFIAALPAGSVEALLEPENRGRLREILTCHVVANSVMSDAIAGMIADDGGAHPVPTVGGCTLTARMQDGVITLTDQQDRTATVTIADVVQSNGVIHVIDTVLLPGA